MDTFKEALAEDGPVLVDVRVTKEENCYPMIPAGPGRTGHGGLSMGEPGTKEVLSLEDLQVTGGGRTGPQARALDPGREQARRAGPDRRACSPGAGSTSTRWPWAPRTTQPISRFTLTVDGAAHPIDQVTKQLHKLVNVIKIRDLEPGETVARELALFKISCRRRDARAR